VFCAARYGRAAPSRGWVSLMNVWGLIPQLFISPLGTIAPTCRDIEVRTIDVLTITAGVVSTIWVVSDDLGLLRQHDAAKLA
jgi:hypothetical protein